MNAGSRSRSFRAAHAALLAIVASVTTVPHVAHAQGRGGAANDATRHEEARQHFEQGVAFAGEARWTDAIRELEAARDIRPTPSVYYNLGVAYRAVGRLRDAISALRQYLSTVGAEADEHRRADIIAMVTQLSTSIARVQVHVTPVTASVSLDGVALPVGASWQDVDPGRHTIVATADGYQTVTRAIDVAPSGSHDLEIRLVQTAAAAHLVVETNRTDSAIRIDDQLVGNGTADEIVAGGRHAIDVSALHASPFHREIDVLVGGTQRVQVTLIEQHSVFASPLFWGGVGAVLIGAVVTTLVVVLSGPVPPDSFGSGYTRCIGPRCAQ